MSFKLSFSVGLVIAALAMGVGCGGGDGGTKGTGGATGTGGAGTGSGGAGGSAGPDLTKAPCYSFCMARETKKDCNDLSSLEDCVGYTKGCGEDYPTLTTACQNAYKAYWSCIAGQTDPCLVPGTCGSQGEAVGTACN